MSDFRSIAMVTAALQQFIQTAVNEVLGKAKVTVGPPSDKQSETDPEVNLYLYNLSTNAELRNHDLPRWGADGALWRQPQAAINLHYLVAFGGSGVEPELMMGKVVGAFHGLPQINRARLAGLAHGSLKHPKGAGLLKGANLDGQHDTIAITPAYLDFEETAKLWSSFFQVRHRRSLMYEVHPLMIDAPKAAALPEVDPVSQKGPQLHHNAHVPVLGPGT
jgi:hypothetical protein